MSIEITKITPWIPLLIAAGYFLFLIATWLKYTSHLEEFKREMKPLIAKIEPKTDES